MAGVPSSKNRVQLQLCEECSKKLIEAFLFLVKADIDKALKNPGPSAQLALELQSMYDIIKDRLEKGEAKYLASLIFLFDQIYVLECLRAFFLLKGCFYGAHLIEDIFEKAAAELAILSFMSKKSGERLWV